jgi:hypothetical protein
MIQSKTTAMSDQEGTMNAQARTLWLALIGGALFIPIGAAGQPREGTSEEWTLSRTSWGDPNLQGDWSFATITPLERPTQHSGRERLTDEEVAALNLDALTRADRPPPPGDPWAYNAFWFDRGESTGRTALIVDPPDGRIPFRPEGRHRRDTRRELLGRPAYGPEDRSPGERCVHHTKAGPPMSAGGYNNNLRLLQTPGYVVVWTEQIHDARIIPMDGRPTIAPAIKQWMGDSRGHWDGDTLVVETGNFNGKAGYQGSAERLSLVERFTRTDATTLHYEYRVTDASSYASSWTAAIDMKPVEGDLYEFACHEGNYGMTGILAGARADEAAATASH